jgi:hypothetical protein
MAIHLGGGWLVVERAHVGVLVERVAESHHRGRNEGGLDEVIVDRIDDDHPLGGTANLAGVVVRPIDGGFGRGGNVGVVGDDGGPVARHFHDRAFDAHTGDDLAAGLTRPGETHRIDSGVVHQRITHRGPSRDHGNQPLGHACCIERLRQLEQRQ